MNAVDNNGMQPVDLAMASVTNREAVLEVLRAADATAREYYQPLELRALLYSERNASRMNATTMFRKSSTPMT